MRRGAGANVLVGGFQNSVTLAAQHLSRDRFECSRRNPSHDFRRGQGRSKRTRIRASIRFFRETRTLGILVEAEVGAGVS